MIYQALKSDRFIPVHTGNTLLFQVGCHRQTVYPCAYREHISDKENIMCANGLSLCIQGTHRPHRHLLIILRFIPVHTGNTGDTL